MVVDSVTLVVRAHRMATRDASLRIERADWDILSCLYEAKKWVSINVLICEFNARSKPAYNRWNGWYYKSVERLMRFGLVAEMINSRGHRRWQITIAGRLEIDKLNKAALALLKKWEEEGE
jgi:hypothetical protein